MVRAMASEIYTTGMTSTFQTVEIASESFRNMLSTNPKTREGNFSWDNYGSCEKAKGMLCEVTDKDFPKHHYGSQLEVFQDA